MKLLFLAATLVAQLPWLFGLSVHTVDDDAHVGQRGFLAGALRHRKTSSAGGTFISDLATPSRRVDGEDDKKDIAKPVRADKKEEVATVNQAEKEEVVRVKKDDEEAPVDMMQSFYSTKYGICMYTLPAHFNIGLLNSTFHQSVPQPLNISPASDPPLQGMFDTIQFSLERIFYDRFMAVATETRPAKDCLMFYVPYFVAWETSSVAGTWKNAYRPALDAELVSHLTHYNVSGVPGRNHFLVVGRISFNVFHFLRHPTFEHMSKLVLEDTAPGQFSNVFAIPYPTWFRYYPGLEPSAGMPGAIQLQSAEIKLKRDVQGCNPSWLGNVSMRVRLACEGRAFCSYHILPELDAWLVGEIYEAMDANGEWWPVTINEKNEDGTFSVRVHDEVGTKWPAVFKTHMRKHGQIASAAAHNTTTKCPALDVSGKYSCGGTTSYAFSSLPGQEALGHAVVLGCPRGPCWLWGSCQHRAWDVVSKKSARSGPLLAFIGSARPTEYERNIIFQMCKIRPSKCSIYSTGARENSTSFVHNRIGDMYQLLMASTFCVNPPGDTPTRKGLFDSLVLGCIPVVTSEDSLQHYKFHLPDWRSVSLLVTTDQLFSAGFNLVDFLASYEQSHAMEIAQKQEAIRKHAYSLQYSFAPSGAMKRGPDAFDRTLDMLMTRPVSPPNQQDYTGLYHIVNVKSGRRLYASSSGEYHTAFGASTGDAASIPMDQQWRISGKGDGSCCYALINGASNRAVYAQVNSTDWSNLGASVASRADWADQRWRLHAEDAGTYTLVNIASGRRLFALDGFESNIGIGASLATGREDQKWRLELVPQKIPVKVDMHKKVA